MKLGRMILAVAALAVAGCGKKDEGTPAQSDAKPAPAPAPAAAAQKKSAPVGDMAAIRDALANLVDVIDRCDSGSPLWWHCGAKGVKPLKDAKAALAKPPRQCDVGTPSEQADRHRELCLKHGGCSTCPRNKEEWSYKDCILDWAQMPFEKEGVAK